MPPKNGVDHTFRRTWDREEFAVKAAERDAKGSDLADNLFEGRIEKAAAVPLTQQQSVKIRDAGALQRELDARINTVRDVSGGIDATLRDRSPFYCEKCAFGAMDSMAWMDHINSLSHQRRHGTTLAPARSNVDDVQSRIAALAPVDGVRGAIPSGSMQHSSQSDEYEQRLARRRKAGAAALAAVRRARGSEGTANNDNQGYDGGAADVEMEPAGGISSSPAPVKNTREHTRELSEPLTVDQEETAVVSEEDQMAKLMGFGTFGSSKR